MVFKIWIESRAGSGVTFWVEKGIKHLSGMVPCGSLKMDLFKILLGFCLLLRLCKLSPKEALGSCFPIGVRKLYGGV